MKATEKTCFLPVHPKYKSLKPEILSVSYNFRELWLESNTATALTLGGAGEEGGLHRLEAMLRKEQLGWQEKVFSRTILPFGAASYSFCDEREPRNSSGICTDYFCMALFPAQETLVRGILPPVQEELSPGHTAHRPPSSLLPEEREPPHFALRGTPEKNHKLKHRLPSTLSAQ